MNSNGRVNIINHQINNPFQLYDKIPIQQKTSYRDVMTGNWTLNSLSRVFFCPENMQIIQNDIKAGVYKNSNGSYIIGDQNKDTLLIIMRSIFLQHSANQPNNITAQVEALNKLVVNYCVPNILGEAEGYIKYKHDASTISVPHRHPVSTYRNKSLQLKHFF